jgi:phosphohistidine phosphatase
MRIYLVHHAEAVEPDVDAMRPLSSRGRSQAAWLASEARAAGVQPAAIWHSGKLRSRQTGEAFLVACNPFASFRMVRGLNPDDGVDVIADALELEDADVMVVGHMPHLPALTNRLFSSAAAFPLHGLVAMERAAHRSYEEKFRISLPREA